MRRRLVTVIAVLAALAAVGGLVAAFGGGSTVTRARLERALPVVFSHVYVERAHLLGDRTLTVADLNAVAMCDKHGPDVPDVGPGGDWVCLVSWSDPSTPMPPEGYGKFELNVHSNGCFTASAPSRLVGFLTFTAADGREVTNPAFEFDGCFDPDGDDSPTGVSFPSLLSVVNQLLVVDAEGRPTLQLSCGPGDGGCAGTVTAAAGAVELGSVDYDLREQDITTVTFDGIVPPRTEVTFSFAPDHGVPPGSPVTLRP